LHDEHESDGQQAESTGAASDRAAEASVSLSQLADLQAGLIDNTTAAELRRRIRDEPELARQFAVLEQVRHSVANLRADTAPAIPAEVAARIGAALRAAGAPAPEHRVVGRRPQSTGHGAQRLLRRPAVAVASAAALVAIGVGGVQLLSTPDHPISTGPTAASVTVPRQAGMPWSDQQILGLLARPADLGTLADSGRLPSCLRGLGYSDARVLGAAPVTALGRPEVLLVLPRTGTPSVMALLVSDKCNAQDAGLVADAVIERAGGDGR
jgi:hypothetical protein